MSDYDSDSSGDEYSRRPKRCCPKCKRKKCQVIGFGTTHVDPTDDAIFISISQPPGDGAIARTTGTPEVGGEKTILLNSSGTFNPCTGKICGGGRYIITSEPPDPNTNQCGTYVFTEFFSFDECPGRLGNGIPPFKFSFTKSSDNIRAGKLVGRVRFSDGDVGTMSVLCRLPQDNPDGVPTIPRGILPEGVITNKGCLDFPVFGDPNDQQLFPPPPASNTLIWVVPPGETCSVCNKGICKCKFFEFYDADHKSRKKKEKCPFKCPRRKQFEEKPKKKFDCHPKKKFDCHPKKKFDCQPKTKFDCRPKTKFDCKPKNKCPYQQYYGCCYGSYYGCNQCSTKC